MFSLRDLIFTPEVVSQSQQLFQSPDYQNESASQLQTQRSLLTDNLEPSSSSKDVRFETDLNKRNKSIHVTATAYKPRRLILGDDDYNSDNDDDNTEQEEEKLPRMKKERRQPTPTDKSIPRAILSVLPSSRENPTTLYRNAPQNSDNLNFDGKPLYFAQNSCAYLKYPQDHNFLPNQRILIRETWNRCYYGKDFTGALMALNTLAEVDYVHAEDLEKLLDMLNQANVANGIGLDGAMLLFQQHLQVMSDNIRGLILKSFVRFLFLQDDVKSAKNILRSFRTQTSPTQQIYFLVCDALLACYQLIKEADGVLQQSSRLRELLDIDFPVIGQLLSDPFLFYFPVKFLYHFSKGHLDEELFDSQNTINTAFKVEIEKRKILVTSLLKETQRAFVMTKSAPSVFSMVDFQQWHIAFLLGYNLSNNVPEIMSSMLNNADSSDIIPEDHRTISQKICDVISQVMVNFSSPSIANSLLDDSMLQELVYLQVHNSETTLETVHESFSNEEVYQHWFRCFFGLETTNNCIRYLSAFLEYHPETPQTLQDYQERWLVWKMLAALLGPLPQYMPYLAPIDIRHPVGNHIPEIVYANQLYANIDHQEYLRDRRRQQMQWSEKNNSSRFNDPRYPTQRKSLADFREQCQWWLETLLAGNQLDDFSSSLVEADIDDVLDAIDMIRTSREKKRKKDDLGAEGYFYSEKLQDDELSTINGMNENRENEQDSDDAHMDISSFEKFTPPQVYSHVFNHSHDYWCALNEKLTELVNIPEHEWEESLNETMIMTSMLNRRVNISSDTAGDEKNIDPIVDFSFLSKITSKEKLKTHPSAAHLCASSVSTEGAISSEEEWLPFGPQLLPSNSSQDHPDVKDKFIQEVFAMIVNRKDTDYSRLYLSNQVPIPTMGDVLSDTNQSFPNGNYLNEKDLKKLISDYGSSNSLRRQSRDVLSLYYQQIRSNLGLPMHRFSLARVMVDSYHRPAHVLWYSSIPTNAQPTYLQVRIPAPLSKAPEDDVSEVMEEDNEYEDHLDTDINEKKGDTVEPKRERSRRFADIRQRQQQYERMRCYDSGDLEILTFQALVAAHLLDQDNFFTVRVVQILCHHVLRSELVNDNESTATECLVYLAVNRINLRRCIAKGLEFACRNIPIDQAPPSFYLSNRAGPLQNREFEGSNKSMGDKESTGTNEDSREDSDVMVDEENQCKDPVEALIADRRQRRQKEREQMMTLYRDQAHEIELVAGLHTFYDPVQFEPRKVL